MRKRFDAVDDVGVAFPLDHRAAFEVRREYVTAGLVAFQLPVAHEACDEVFARGRDVGDFRAAEHVLANHVAIAVEKPHFVRCQVSAGHGLPLARAEAM